MTNNDDGLRKFVKWSLITVFALIASCIGTFVYAEISHRLKLERISGILDTEPTYEHIASAIPAQFDLGMHRDEVVIKFYELDSSFEEDSTFHSYKCTATTTPTGCADSITFYYHELPDANLSFGFYYDEKNKLMKIERNADS